MTQYLSFFVWIISLSIMPSTSIHVTSNGNILFFFYSQAVFKNIYVVCIYMPHLLYLFIDECSGCSPVFCCCSFFFFFFFYDVLEHFNFILLSVTFQLSPHHLIKRLPLLIYYCLFCSRLIGRKCVGLFLGSLFCFIDLCICFCASIILFDSCSFVI